ncbi:MAG: YggS family pyridoxal phosphate-dependent enzyme [Pseudomonadota bacterium]
MSETPPQWTHVAQGLREVQARLERAAAASGRQAHEVTLVAVSKTFPATAVCAAAVCGQRHFGESYVQEALPKMAKVQAMLAADIESAASRQPAGVASPQAGPLLRPLVWHFIGPIQSNKTRDIAQHFDWVHGIEREKIARRLSGQRPQSLPPLNVCIQVNVSGEASKSGVAPDEAAALADVVFGLPRLKLRGLMAIPEPGGDAHARFRLLRELLENLNARGLALDTLSMGMSDDFETAIAEGATIIRVGSAIFGKRNYDK